MPYSLGPDTLPPEPTAAGKTLSPEKEENLSKDMRELYGRLVPTLESEDRRQKFITKLDKILSERWPTSAIKVNVFGSTGNNLGTLTSDVDVCITTDDKELTRICAIAELLAAKGMERVVCVSSAKVPIVKVWDPELQMACDLNVNNPIALENTALIRSYVDIDDRVRPLAMIVKHWAKQRILNDAGMLSADDEVGLLTYFSSWWYPEFIYLDLLDFELPTDAQDPDTALTTIATWTEAPCPGWCERLF